MLVTVALLIVVVVVMLVMLLLELTESLGKSVLMLDSGENIGAREHIPWGRDYRSGGVVLANDLGRLLDPHLLGGVGMRKDDSGRTLYLIAEELAKVLHIHLALSRVNDGGKRAELELCALNAHNCLDNIGELANSGGLDEDSVGVVLCKHLCECL